MNVTFTDAAADRVNSLLSVRSDMSDGLRIFVKGGGCGGYQYGFAYESELQEGDKAVTVKGAKFYLDAQTLELMDGSVVDYVDDVNGAFFDIKNPQAQSTCGCGSSFYCEK